METICFVSVLTAEVFRHFSVPKHSMNKADGLDPWLSVCLKKSHTKPAGSMLDTATLTDAQWAAFLPLLIFGRSQVRTRPS